MMCVVLPGAHEVIETMLKEFCVRSPCLDKHGLNALKHVPF